MTATQIELGSDLVEVLSQLDQPLAEAARELIVLELYRRGTVSSGRAATLLNLDCLSFIQYAARLGIPYFDMTGEEWGRETALLDTL